MSLKPRKPSENVLAECIEEARRRAEQWKHSAVPPAGPPGQAMSPERQQSLWNREWAEFMRQLDADDEAWEHRLSQGSNGFGGGAVSTGLLGPQQSSNTLGAVVDRVQHGLGRLFG
jgi:hypothetical protein